MEIKARNIHMCNDNALNENNECMKLDETQRMNERTQKTKIVESSGTLNYAKRTSFLCLLFYISRTVGS